MEAAGGAVEYKRSGTARAFQPTVIFFLGLWILSAPLSFVVFPGLAFAIGAVAGLVGYAAGCVWFSSFRYCVLPDRVLLRNGIISKNDLEISMIRVQSVTIDRTYMERMLGVGSLRMSTAGALDLDAWIYSIKDFDGVANFILERSEEARLASDLPKMMRASPNPELARELDRIRSMLERILGGPDRHLKVPSLEVMNREFRMSPRMVTVWTLETLVGLIVVWSFLAAGLVLLLGPVGALLALLLLATFGVLARAYAGANYLNYTFSFDSEFLTVRHGIFFKDSMKLPYKRIQNIDVYSSYFGRMWGLHSVRAVTASGSAHIHGIEDPDPAVYFLLEQAEDARFDDALGDATELEDYHIKILRQVKKINYRLRERMGLFDNPFDERANEFGGSQMMEPQTATYHTLNTFLQFMIGSGFIFLPGAVVLVPYAAWYGPRLFRSYRLRFDFDSLFSRKGVWTIWDEMIPYRRIQNAYVHQGILMRWLGIQAVAIHGPGMHRNLPGIRNPQGMVAYIMRRAEEARAEEGHDLEVDAVQQIASGLRETNRLLREFLEKRARISGS